MKLDGAALDRFITGNYGEDQFDRDFEHLCETLCNDCECADVCKYADEDPMRCKRFKNTYDDLKEYKGHDPDREYDESKMREFDRHG